MDPLEQVADGDVRKQFELTVLLYRSGEWKYEFKTSSPTTTAEQKGKTRHFRTCCRPGSDGSSVDKLCFNLKFNPWDTAIAHRPEWHSMSNTVFTQYDPYESWCSEQKDAWPDDVKTFYRPPKRCLNAVRLYFQAQRDTDLLAESARARICINVSRFSPDPYKDKRATLNKKQKTETSNGEPFVTKTNQASWNLLTHTISHGQTIMYILISAIEASKKAVGCSFQMFDAGKNGLQLIDGSVMKLKNE